MTTPTYTVPCLSNDCIARDIYEFRLQKPAGFSFESGQFVLFNVPLRDKPEDIQTRAFSVASAPSETDLLFVAKLKEGGRASIWIEEMLHTGSDVTMQGPFGRFVLKNSGRDVLFVCTSTGVAPFRSQLKTALEQDAGRRLDLLFGTREEEDLFWIDEFRALEKEYAGFTLHTALSQPAAGWQGQRGRVQALVPQIVDDLTERDVYICGNPDMTADVKHLCLEEWGVPKEQLHVEGYI